jgi:hypothetical protein
MLPAGGDRRSILPRKGLKSSSSGLGAGAGRGFSLEGVRRAGPPKLPPTRRSDLPEPGVASLGRVGVGASLTSRLPAKRAARTSEGLCSTPKSKEGSVGFGAFCGDLDLLLSKTSGL